MKYYVTSVYYKHGAYSVKSFDIEKDVREYLIEECLEIIEDREKFSHLNRDVLENMSTMDLIETSKEVGEFSIDNQHGYGIISVIKGEEM